MIIWSSQLDLVQSIVTILILKSPGRSYDASVGFRPDREDSRAEPCKCLGVFDPGASASSSKVPELINPLRI